MPRRAKEPENTVKIWGKLRDAVEGITGELDTRPDVLDRMTSAEVARRLIAYAVAEHQAGRGPWPKR